ncbi:MAG TPA: metal ABC transporter substrate-binding protein [Patescibacteria group bacterium]|nr:metal ABC transporter substrate-binding protein [Patescibacteria group bacterium]
MKKITATHARIILACSFLCTIAAWPAGAAATAGKLSVVATLPNLGSIAQEIGADHVDVMTIASGLQDAHFVDPKPSFIVKLRSADLILVNGLDLEIGWVPPLTQGARNSKLLPGGPGYIDCSSRISVLEIPTGTLSRAEGDVHPFGNPHYLGDPLNAEQVAGVIADAFKRTRPADAEFFEKRRADFVKRLHAALFGPELVDLVGGAKLSRLAQGFELEAFLQSGSVDGKPLASHLGGWLGKLRPYAGVKVVTYHKDYSYFEKRFQLDVAEYVEPKPGIPPSLKHIDELTQRLSAGDIRLLITRPYVEHRSTDQLSEKSKLPVVTLPLEVGGAPEATDFFKLFDYVTSQIVTALGPPPAGR